LITLLKRVKLSATRMASVKMANKETQSYDKKQGIGLEEDFKKLKLKRDEAGLAKEGGKMKKEKAPAKKEEEKTTGIASKDEKAVVEVGPEEFLKHPLQNAWTLWFFKNDKARTWEENQRPILTVATVEDFWSLYNHVSLASNLPPGSDYSFFKEGIFPDWEDEKNGAGGRWIINSDRQQRVDILDTHWLEILIFMIGEQAEVHASKVNGAVVNLRAKGDKLGVWLADTAADSVLRVGRMVKERLGLPKDQTIVFNVHREDKAKSGADRKTMNKLTV